MHSDGEEWIASQSSRIIHLIDTFARNSSNLEFGSTQRVYLKLVLHNVEGHGWFTLPPKLAKKRQAIINVDSKFRFVLLSVLHYDEVVNQHRRNLNKYDEWEGKLNFGDVDVDNIKISDITKIERLTNLKINVHAR